MDLQKQDALDIIYTNYMNHVLSFETFETALTNCKISSPQFIDVNVERGNYINGSFKILFVGQETFGWVSDDLQKLECGLPNPKVDLQKYIYILKNIYKEFNIGIDYYNSPIYQFINNIVKEKKDVGFLMNNCLRHDGLGSGSNRLPNDIESIVTFESNYVFKNELEILKPDCVIFLTGPSYDNVIRKTFDNVEFIEHKDFHVNEFSLVKHDNLPIKTYRIYHPNYHNRRGGDYKYLISNEICNLIFE